MRLLFSIVFLISLFALVSCSQGHKSSADVSGVVWEPGVDVETFWADYAEATGGLTWGASDTYPPYSEVNEGDTFLVQLEQGPCLMEFFHRRWRRANDVRRWDESVNDYGGCPYVFD